MHKKIARLDYYCFSSTGQIVYDPKKGKVFEPFWALLKCDELGLKPLKPMALHLTIGRLLIERENKKKLTPYYYDD